MISGIRSFASGAIVVGFFLTTLAFWPSAYFRAENAPEPPRPSQSTAGPTMLAVLAGHRRAESQSAVITTDSEIGVDKTDRDGRAIGAAPSVALAIRQGGSSCSATSA